MKDLIFRKLYLGLSAILIVSALIPILPVEALPQGEIKVAQAAAPNPQGFQVSVRDHHCADQEGYSSVVAAGGSSSATDSNAKDPDCGRIQFLPGDVTNTPPLAAIYTNDFRIGTKLAESESGCTRDQGAVRWTPWASEGGGASWGATANSNVNDPDCLWIYYETRAMPAGIQIKNARVGISTGYGGFQYTPWARSGGGWSSYSGGGNISPARVALDIQFVEVYDAEWVSDTIPETMQQGQSGNYEIVMRNLASAWISDSQTPAQDNCETRTPSNQGEICVTDPDPILTSSSKLQFISGDSEVTINTPTPLPYRRPVHRTYTAGDYCLDWGVTTYQNDEQNYGIFSPVIKTVQAAVRSPEDDPNDPDPPGSPVCSEWGLKFFLTSQTPAESNVTNTNTATFPISLTIDPNAASGTYNLRFQMMLASGQLFGGYADIQINVGSQFSLVCGADVVVPVGSIAEYAIGAAPLDDLKDPISVTMTSSPVGPEMVDSPPHYTNPLVLDMDNSFAGIAGVDTTGLSASTTYILTFAGNDGINPEITCQSLLNVIESTPFADIKFNGSDGPVFLDNQTSGTIKWHNENAEICTAGTTPSPVSPAWNGSAVVNPVGDGSLAVSGIAFNTTYTFSLSCTNGGVTGDPDYVYVSSQPTAPTVDIKCAQDQRSEDGPCSVLSGQSGSMTWESSFASSCTMNQSIGNVPINQTDPFSTGNLTADTTFRITCTGPGGSDFDEVTFTVTQPPLAPANVATRNDVCGAITVTWTHGGSPAATGFRVYHQYAPGGPGTVDPNAWVDISGLLGAEVRSYDHTPGQANYNYYMVRAFNGAVQSPNSNTAGPAGIDPCEAEITDSDKDLVSVDTVVRPVKADCSAESEYLTPPLGAFLAGQTAKFKMNICNTGNQPFTSVSVTDNGLNNLTNPRNFVYTPAGCESSAATINGNSFTAHLDDVAPGTICSITFDATITAPSGPASSLYRFYNNAVINYNGTTFPLYSAHHPFRVGAGVPDRNETAP